MTDVRPALTYEFLRVGTSLCFWRFDVLELTSKENIAYQYSKEDLQQLEPRLWDVITTMQATRKDHHNLQPVIVSSIDYWNNDTVHHLALVPGGTYETTISQFDHIYPDGGDPDVILTVVEFYTKQPLLHGGFYADGSNVEVLRVARAWFDQYTPGASERIKLGYDLNLAPGELLDYAITPPIDVTPVQPPETEDLGPA